MSFGWPAQFQNLQQAGSFWDILKYSSSVLSVVNGTALFYYYLRDRPKLEVKAIHPDTYQWYFPLPSSEYEEQGEVYETRKYGFLAYVSILNKGLRDVGLNKWRFFPRTEGLGWRGTIPSLYWVEFKPINLPEARIKLKGTDRIKKYPVLGQADELFEGSTMIKSGSAVSGFSYFVSELAGKGSSYHVDTSGNTVKGMFVAESVFGNKGKQVIEFERKNLAEVERLVPGISEIDQTTIKDTEKDTKIIDPTTS